MSIKPQCPHCRRYIPPLSELCPYCGKRLMTAITDPDDHLNKGPYIKPDMRRPLQVYGLILAVIFSLVAWRRFDTAGFIAPGGWTMAVFSLLSIIVTLGRSRKASIHMVNTPLQIAGGLICVFVGWWWFLRFVDTEPVGWMFVGGGALLLTLIGRRTVRGGGRFDGMPDKPEYN